MPRSPYKTRDEAARESEPRFGSRFTPPRASLARALDVLPMTCVVALA
jgi:hypothetical protein